MITEQVAAQHNQPLEWRNERLNTEQWNDPERMIAEILEQRLRTEGGTALFPGGESRSVTQGHLNGAQDAFVNSLWAVGGDHEWQFTANQDFYTDDDGPSDVLARHLDDYPIEWLVNLVRQTAQCVDADEARIHTMGIFKAMKKYTVPREIRRLLGAVTFAPHGITDTALPDSVSLHPGIDTKPDSVILTVDLDTAVNNPATIIDDLLAVHAAMRPGSAA